MNASMKPGAIQRGAALAACSFGLLSSAGAVVLQDFTGSVNATGQYGSFNRIPGADGLRLTAINGDGGIWMNQPNRGLINSDLLQITLKLGPTNTDDQFQILLLDSDNGPGARGEAYRYMIPTSNFNADTFTTFTFGPLTAFTGFNPGTFGRSDGDGIQNFVEGVDTGLYEFQIQGDFAGGGQTLDIIVQNVSVVPEPSSVGLLGLGGVALLLRRRKH